MAKFDIKKEYPKLYRATTKKISSLTIPMIKYCNRWNWESDSAGI